MMITIFWLKIPSKKNFRASSLTWPKPRPGGHWNFDCGNIFHGLRSTKSRGWVNINEVIGDWYGWNRTKKSETTWGSDQFGWNKSETTWGSSVQKRWCKAAGNLGDGSIFAERSRYEWYCFNLNHGDIGNKNWSVKQQLTAWLGYESYESWKSGTFYWANLYIQWVFRPCHTTARGEAGGPRNAKHHITTISQRFFQWQFAARWMVHQAGRCRPCGYFNVKVGRWGSGDWMILVPSDKLT